MLSKRITHRFLFLHTNVEQQLMVLWYTSEKASLVEKEEKRERRRVTPVAASSKRMSTRAIRIGSNCCCNTKGIDDVGTCHYTGSAARVRWSVRRRQVTPLLSLLLVQLTRLH